MLFFGLALLGLIVLTLSATYSRRATPIIIWGIIGGALLWQQLVILRGFAQLDTATAGGHDIEKIIGIGEIAVPVILLLYFMVAFLKRGGDSPHK